MGSSHRDWASRGLFTGIAMVSGLVSVEFCYKLNANEHCKAQALTWLFSVSVFSFMAHNDGIWA